MHISVNIVLLLFVCSCNVISTPVPETENTAETARIVNGYEVDITEIAYQASLRRKSGSGYAHICGAVVITTRAALTAAHCAASYVTSPSSLQITVGTSYRLSGGKSYEISTVVVHEDYSISTLEHDIAVLVTAKIIKYNQSVSPIAVANEYMELPSGTEAIVSGFGTTSYEGSSSSVLMAARVNIVSQDICARAYMRIASITSGMLCANATSPPRDACQGDSGGPLVAKSHLVGIVSWGEGCADTVYPGVYTRVSKYNEWIWKNVGKYVSY